MGDILNPGAAAAKNNENQQAAAVNNSQQAWKGAATNLNAWNAANPNPLASASIAAPKAMASPQQQIMQAPAPQVVGQQPAHAAIAPAQQAQGAQAAMAQPPQQKPTGPPQINSQVLQAILGAV